MSDIKEMTKGSLNPLNILDTVRYNILFARDNPYYFYPAGIWVFCGPQGSGKTLSAVQLLKKLCTKYPRAVVCSNLEIKGLDREVIPFTDYSQISKLTNGIEGVIFFIDELHVLWNSLESKEIPISEMACFCQMRKDRRVIIGTSQVYSRIAKPIREQLQYVIDCKNLFGLFQMNTVIDPQAGKETNGELEGEIVCHRYWFHSPKLYGSYDTLFKITKAQRKELKKNARTRSATLHGSR